MVGDRLVSNRAAGALIANGVLELCETVERAEIIGNEGESLLIAGARASKIGGRELRLGQGNVSCWLERLGLDYLIVGGHRLGRVAQVGLRVANSGKDGGGVRIAAQCLLDRWDSLIGRADA